ncbi:hypothetical protein AB204_02485 [Xenorhabdus khoisanae]|uniref:Uncharacterized protein n=1 Tax=Xenorhabdus khoisanae TaxID=880157 RepID=A0A0J5FWY0_9GAMM|nr:hypothetical protein [Xenorhabdus khoisanae]KMJ46703.1 hypothetical protein AB204_02485 [Xenorhabdus khoisanae]
MSVRNNQNLRRICLALRLNRNEIFDILQGKYSKSQIDGWGRAVDARKQASGNSTAETVPRFRPMSDQQFDEFCDGLIGWMKSE